MIQLKVTRKRANKRITPDQLRAIMALDPNTILDILPAFVIDGGGDYIGKDAAQAQIGALTIRQFIELAQRFAEEVAVTPTERRDLRFAFEHSAPTLPAWIRVLDMAKAWGCPPWEVAEDDQKQLWLRRFNTVETIRAKAKRK